MEKFETQEEMTGYITGKVKGGFIATVEGALFYAIINNSATLKIDHLLNTPVKVIATRIDKARGNVCIEKSSSGKSKNAKISKL